MTPDALVEAARRYCGDCNPTHVAAFAREQIREAVAGALEEAARKMDREWTGVMCSHVLKTHAAAIRRGEG